MKINRITPNYSVNKRTNNTQQSFKGIQTPEPIVNLLSKGYEKTAGNVKFKNCIEMFSHLDKSFSILLAIESCIISGFYMVGTLTNDKIEKEQKPQMLLNDAMTLGVSTAGAFIFDNKLTQLFNKIVDFHYSKHMDFYKQLGSETSEAAKTGLLDSVAKTVTSKGDEFKKGASEVANNITSTLSNIVAKEGKKDAFSISAEKLQEIQDGVKTAMKDNVGDIEKAQKSVKKLVDEAYDLSSAKTATMSPTMKAGLGKLKSLLVFGIAYRFLSPVLVTPIANKLSAKIFTNKDKEAEKTQEKK